MPTDISKIISDAAYQAYERRLLHQVRQAAIPHHVAIIMDGNRQLLPAEVIEAIEYAEARTKDYDSYRFNLAVAYGGREEILQAIRDVVRDAQAGKVDPHDIDEKFSSKRLYTADMPDPDLVLRTNGEKRVSNFLLWQLAYSELCFF